MQKLISVKGIDDLYTAFTQDQNFGHYAKRANFSSNVEKCITDIAKDPDIKPKAG